MADDYASIVEQAYLDETGRASDPEGAAYWTGLLESGAITPADLSAAFSGTTEGLAFDQGAGTSGVAGLSVGGGGSGVSNEDFVRQTYLNETGRPGETAGVRYWNDLLSSGAITRDQLSAAFSGTPEGAAFDAAAQAQTQGGGQTTGTTTGTQTAVSGGIGTLGAGTAGQTATTASPDVRSFLEGQYQSEFGRQFDAPGLDYWADQIQKGNITKEQVAEIFSKSPEGLKYDIANLAAGKTTDVGFLPSDLLKRYSDLQAAYQTAVYRPGDVEGLKYWLANPTDYSKALGGSDEAFVQKTYRDVLKSAPDAKGLQYWMGQLSSGVLKREELAKALTAAQKQTVREQDIAKNKVVFNPFTSTIYSNLAMSDRASDFGNFPIIRGTRTTETGAVVPAIRLNLQQRPSASLGIRSFAPVAMSSYAYDPSSKSLFGGERLFGGTGMTGGTSYNIFGTPTAVQTVQTTGGGAQGAGGETEVVMAANGGMISSDPVMRRAMFKAGGPVSSVGMGITSNVASPEENAKALQTMFAPGFRRGGPVQHFYNGGEAKDVLRIGDPSIEGPSDVIPIEVPASVEEPSTSTQEPYVPKTPAGRSIRDFFYPSQKAQEKIDRAMEEKARADAVEEARRRNPVPSVFSEVTDAEREAARQRQQQAVDQASGVTSARDIASREIQEREELDMYRQAAEDEARYRGAAAAAAARDTAPARTDGGATREPVKDRMSLRLEELKAEREANKEKRRENQLLALMQAGFAAAAGRSPNALANIAAGGISGVQTLAELNKDVRAEDRALRREILETELTQERMREAAAERRAAREQTAAERQRTLLQTVSSNARQEISSISQLIGTEEGKLLTPGITEEQKAPIKAEIARLKNQREAALEQMYGVYENLGIRRPRTVEQESAGFSWRVKK